ncbi:hypothetical protein BIU88_04350 [Chlorobaculum limnaeum]|uniref:Uncharacterized protein n=1 Tax=Chlorobaculum limnaeum TaxID=274537 RepID=A0A1D8CZ84_CHLLM|nr:hypothetical protein BIU88_04350 [Chlorobaculum limnaeum]
MSVPVNTVVTPVFAVATTSDIVPPVPSDLVRQAPVPHRSPRATVVPGAVPAAVAVDKEIIAITDHIVVPAVGDSEAVIVDVDEIGAVVIDIKRYAKVDIQIDFCIRIVWGCRAEQQSRNTGAGQKE